MSLLACVRRHRHLWGGALLVLMLCLAPMRAWAQWAMHAPATAAAFDAAASALPPCHSPGDDSTADGDGHAAADSMNCALCSLCHSASLPLTLATLSLPPLQAEAPATSARGAAPPAQARLERPPRG